MKMLSFVLILILGNYYANCHVDSDSVMVYTIVKAYHKLLKFTEKFLPSMNVDGLCGMSIAEGNLNKILTLPHLPPTITKAVQNLKFRTNTAIKHRIYQMKNDLELADMFQMNMFFNVMKIISADFWMRKNTTFKKHELQDYGLSWHDNYFFYGSPTEAESEFCLSEIYSLDLNVQKECYFGTMCRNIYFDLNNTHGYSLTHKLLFWQIFSRAKCNQRYDVQAIIGELCSQVLSETKGMLLSNKFDRFLTDLFVEQVLLCGMEGFEEFLERREWLMIIIKWQNDYGCFESHFPPNRRKRDPNYIAYGCNSHLNGLALGYLSLNLNYLLTTNKNIYKNF